MSNWIFIFSLISIVSLVSCGGPTNAVQPSQFSSTIAPRVVNLGDLTSHGDIKCCHIQDGKMSFSENEASCGSCNKPNQLIFVDVKNDDQNCCHTDIGLHPPKKCIYHENGEPDPNENRGKCWDADKTIASCADGGKLHYFNHGYCCCD